MTIGEVVDRLQGAYPDLSISKVRFLEEEELISPERTAGGYRKFSPADVARIELILRLQKDHFLPLAVIREKLVEYDKGRLPAELRGVAGAAAEPGRGDVTEARSVPLDEVPSALGLPTSFIRELEEFGLIELAKGESGPELAGADIQIAHVCWDMRRFGVEPRHLRMYETFAEREGAFFSQILMPAFRHRTAETRQKLADTLGELTGLSEQLTAHLVRRALARTFDDVL